MTLRWASAGHDQPLLYDPATATSPEIEGDGGLPLGVMEGELYEERVHAGLRVGQIMLIGSDGLWESMNAAGELFGKKRVIQIMAELAHLSATEIEKGIYERQQAFCGGRLGDDLTYVVIKLVGS